MPHAHGTKSLQEGQRWFCWVGEVKRFAASYGTDSMDTLLGSAVLPSLFKQDPRYFYKGTGSPDEERSMP
jgi:hypothetical protein